MTLRSGTNCIESERLTMRRITADDLEFFSGLHADPLVTRYLGSGRPRSHEESWTWLNLVLATYENRETGQLAVVRKSDGRLIGRCGLSALVVECGGITGAVPRVWHQGSEPADHRELELEMELGYALHPNCWGRGYASEAAQRVLEYGREAWCLGRVISLIHPHNLRSVLVAQRLNLQREGAVEMLGYPRDRYVRHTL
jgi:RimJ/RimL family protein N-acetyltransferase